MTESELLDEEYSEYMGPVQYCKYEAQHNPRKKMDFMTKFFSPKNKQKKVRRARSPQMRRVQQVKKLSPHRQPENVFIVDEDDQISQSDSEDAQNVVRSHPKYNVLFIEGSPVSDHFDPDKPKKKYIVKDPRKEFSEKGNSLEEIQKNKTYIEVVKVEDRGTDPGEGFIENFKVMQDKSTETICPAECKLPTCEKEREKLNSDLKYKEATIKASLDEGMLLIEDIEKIKKRLSNNRKLQDIMDVHLNLKQECPIDFLHLGRTCVMELGKQYLAVQKQMEADTQKLINELSSLKKEKTEKEGKIKHLERKLEAQAAKVNQEGQDTVQLQLKIGKLQESLETGKKLFRESDKSLKGKIEKLENDLAAQKQSNAQLTQVLNEKSRLITQMESNIARLQNSLEANKQQLKDIQCSYKSKIAKAEAEHTNKMAALCQNQTSANKQLSQALEQSSNYVNIMQETKKENATLLAENNSMQQKISVIERELTKAQERSSVAERKLTRETQEVLSLRSEVNKLETIREEEVLSVDGDTWCQIMYQQDQWILDDLRDNLQDKESYLESLRAQGDCALRDFEKAQNELQQRRQQFSELKDVFLDFERKRDCVVREQREFYTKMMLLSRRSIPRDRFFKNLIEDCQTKTYKIEDLEKTVKNTSLVIEETKKISEAQLKAMQNEIQFTAERLYEFENQTRMKEMQLQEVIRVLEHEKRTKIACEETTNTYKILLEDSKKENASIRSKLNYLEDLEKNRTTVLRATEELTRETQRRIDTEAKLKHLERDLLDMKSKLHAKESKSTPNLEVFTGNSKEVEQMKEKIKDLTENKKYLERILMETQRSKEMLQKDHEELYNKMRQAVHVMVESKGAQESLEFKLERRMHTIQQLQKSQAETEDQIDDLKDVMHEMKETIELLHEEKGELKDKLSNHMHCKAERAMHQELKLLQRDKTITEEQNSREKEMLLDRLRDNEDTMKEQHKHLRAFQEQLDNLNTQLREAKSQLTSERHTHTQQLLTVQADKKKLELYIQELEGRLAFETRLRMQTSDTVITTPKFFTSSDSYDPPIRDHNKHHYYRK